MPDGSVVLEVRVTLRNPSHCTWCIPGVYVAARSLRPEDAQGLRDKQFEDLRLCGDLSIHANVARLPNSVIQLAPDEEESVCRWDLLDVPFLAEEPAIVVQVEVFAVKHEHIGVDHDDNPMPFRKAWLDFMNGEDRRSMIRHRYIPFGRCKQQVGSRAPGKRIIIRPNGDPDAEYSDLFAEVLDGMVQWSRQQTKVLSTTEGRLPTEGNTSPSFSSSR
jgi:hypothetical protein